MRVSALSPRPRPLSPSGWVLGLTDGAGWVLVSTVESLKDIAFAGRHLHSLGDEGSCWTPLLARICTTRSA